MHRFVIALVRVLLVVMTLGCLAAQLVVLPLGSFEFARELGQSELGRIAYLAAAIVAIGCFEAAVFALWILLTRVARRQIFTRAALRWVDTIIVSALAGAALTLAVFLHLAFAYEFVPSGILLVIFAMLIGCLTFVSLVWVMRGLLVRATNLEDELAEVV